MAGSIRKRARKFVVTLDYGKNVLGERIRKVKTCITEDEAEALLTEHNFHMLKNDYVAPDNMTFGELLDMWYENYVKFRNEITTQQEYKRILDNDIKPNLGNIPLQELAPANIQQYYYYLMTKRKKILSPNTVYRHHANIHKALNFAVKQQLVFRNVADAVELPKRIDFEGSFYTVKELQKLRDSLKGSELEIPINLAIYLALRREEIAGLKWKYVDLTNRIIDIKEVRVRTDRKIIEKKPKTKGSIRTLYIPDDLNQLLIGHKQKQINMEKLFGKADYVCTNIENKPFRPEALSRKFTKFLSNNSLSYIRLHDLRHTFATLLYQKGVPIKDISNTLGHSDITTTLKVYSHIMDENNKTVVNKMDELLKENN